MRSGVVSTVGTWRLAVALAVAQCHEARWSEAAIEAAMRIDRVYGSVPEARRVLDDVENECRLFFSHPHLRAIAG
jgi:hypothetical protein